MFFISELNYGLTIESLNNKSKPDDCELIIIERPKQVTVIGKNSVYDNPITPYIHKESLTFIGKKYVHFDESLLLDIYQLKNGEGYVVHTREENIVLVSRSFSKIVDYCLNQGFSILGFIRHNKGEDYAIPHTTINNDFSQRILKKEAVTSDEHLSYDLGWDANTDYINFNMVIEQNNYKVNKEGMFFEEFKGFAPNIGKFRQIILKELEPNQRLPVLFPEATLDRCVVFTDLVDDNAQSVLSPNVIHISEYEDMINSMIRTNKKKIIFSGLHKHGYGVQAFIELLPEEERLDSYCAKVTHLIIAPHDIFLTSQIFH